LFHFLQGLWEKVASGVKENGYIGDTGELTAVGEALVWHL